ncbi:cutinase [Rhizoctonia solani AG-3 Rhs1AP]|uniref:Cutinase n=1 Tax=Rhizoctonia solani AG-3 Rhs1AP TaxID=1086054 RepID=X8IZG6_9AGAM|nr:cutinase [Rhizoctonia solani AG-3 Rhs1AP]
MFFKYLIAPLILAASAIGAPVELEARQSCSALQLVHVAGTTEIGLGVVGTPLALALAASGATTKPITYDTTAEYIVTVAAGAALTEAYLRLQSAACPNQHFVLSGYSKGALVLHGKYLFLALSDSLNLSSALKSKIASILVFGDPARNINSPWPINNPSVDLAPKDGSSSSQNIASFCNTGDLFCAIPGYSLPAHLAYPTDGSIGVAAAFAKARL